MSKILKFELTSPLPNNYAVENLYLDGEVVPLSVGSQHSKLCMWALVREIPQHGNRKYKTKVHLNIIGTGADIESAILYNMKYLGRITIDTVVEAPKDGRYTHEITYLEWHVLYATREVVEDE